MKSCVLEKKFIKLSSLPSFLESVFWYSAFWIKQRLTDNSPKMRLFLSEVTYLVPNILVYIDLNFSYLMMEKTRIDPISCRKPSVFTQNFHRERTHFTVCKAFLIRNYQCFPEVSGLLIEVQNGLKKEHPWMHIEQKRTFGKLCDSWIDNDHLWALSSGRTR